LDWRAAYGNWHGIMDHGNFPRSSLIHYQFLRSF
jgi:hypothetical protein